MEKYKKLLGKKIKIMHSGEKIAAYTITMINPNPIQIEGLGPGYKCGVEREPSPNSFTTNDSPTMDFELKILDDLVDRGVSQSPIQPQVSFVVEQ